ncbi:MAG: UDP-N-acetylglucosamine 1-carboxyvinyltransferase [Candidatus Yonathbacteria bacterium RIFOXYC1_FULL_52_10]|uniref:UDP-N-acetylglucosamine 1-carboxyvinyltransferase n=1 Tax=Candidatus Yonathbacteria bacterium RIFOXYD1_FULL_52_36 TaxID=1802730 RepID=A0A1G2SK97_9BACT|nr:MAG: UDP-N-acetylglucosamine 1-carboxyvinyltransferase [Candidatus Yonathbacteria bacterium RIFOXYC1_FULL_52_10]OHA85495.1 MAG: UDP-N-acetylglucosamine 1-carboxyvinyltransferase [Candidatus Yonathbacteria bacterium RIFOXYD1_FULL_52_36]
MPDTFVIEGLAGKRTLKGKISVSGAKNAALKLMAASVIFRDKVTLTNIPDIEDVRRMADLLAHMGALVSFDRGTMEILPPQNGNVPELAPDIAKRMRASVVLTGPLLARYGKVSFPHPGGCVIGARPIDLFTKGFEKMGAKVTVDKNGYVIKTAGKKLKGAELFFRKQSVTATETFMIAAVLAQGTTVLKNAAMEPEIEDLAKFLISGGARIEGAGTPTIKIHGDGLLVARGNAHATMPDRIDAGSFIILAALAGDDVEVTRINPAHLEALTSALQEAGIPLEIGKTSIRVRAKGKKVIPAQCGFQTHEYPGFPTDLQAPMTILLTQAHGESTVFETIFEGRLNYTESLKGMGADITMMDPHRVLVRGPRTLRGKNLESPDLRAGLAFVIAAVVAKGRSVIHNVYNIDRGYERIEERLQKIGVKIERIPA